MGASGVTIKGFVINRFGGSAITLFGNNNVVEGNYIGLNAAGTTSTGFGNLRQGVFISGSNNRVGGTTSAQRNIIAGSGFAGVGIGFGSGNVIQGNYIGTDASGTANRPNAGGVAVNSGASNNFIGGIAAGAGNVISGNTGAGVTLNNGANGNTVLGNRIGTNADGTAALGNTGQGVNVSAASSTSVPGSGNLISGNSVRVRRPRIGRRHRNQHWGRTPLAPRRSDTAPMGININGQTSAAGTRHNQNVIAGGGDQQHRLHGSTTGQDSESSSASPPRARLPNNVGVSVNSGASGTGHRRH